MAYPASIDTFAGTAAQGTSLLTSPDHSQDHRMLGSAAGAIEAVLGTTSGTSIAKNFAAGDFASRINSSNVLQQTLTGTINNSVFGTLSATGGTYNSGVFGTPTLTLGSDAQGDVFYRSSGGTITRLGPGTIGQVLQTQGAGANPQWVNPSPVYFSFPVNNWGADRNAAVIYNGLTENAPSTSEAIHQMNIGAGTFTELRLRVTNNSMDQAATIALRRNGTTTALVGTVTALTTGNFVGTASVGVAAGDLMNLSINTTASTVGAHIDIQSFLTKFIAS